MIINEDVLLFTFSFVIKNSFAGFNTYDKENEIKDKEKPLEKTEISYVTEYLQKLSELLREEKLNEMIECPIM